MVSTTRRCRRRAELSGDENDVAATNDEVNTSPQPGEERHMQTYFKTKKASERSPRKRAKVSARQDDTTNDDDDRAMTKSAAEAADATLARYESTGASSTRTLTGSFGLVNSTGPVYVSPLIKRVYRLVDKKSYLDWGLTSDWLTTEKRKRRAPNLWMAAASTARKQLFAKENDPTSRDMPVTTRVKKKKKEGSDSEKAGVCYNDNRDETSEGYGEMTEGSIQRLLRALQTPSTDDGTQLSAIAARRILGKDASFLDLGSGYGKVVLHAALAVHIREAHGIEYVESRHKKATAVLEELRRGKLTSSVVRRSGDGGGGSVVRDGSAAPSNSNGEADTNRLTDRLGKVKLIHGDATKMGRSFGQYSHVYIYDKVFSPRTLTLLVPQLAHSPSLMVMVTYQRPDTWRKCFRECAEKENTLPSFDETFIVHEVLTMRTTGAQNFKAYVLHVRR